MIREIRVPKPFSVEDLEPITNNEELQPESEPEIWNFFMFEEVKPKGLPPKDFEVLIPFLGSAKKVKFKCPNCDKEFITMANGSKDKTYVECDIKFCSSCGQKFDWRV
jgi:predicted RNA-binding Zn-ribbon protein involved in translation (DUF1610 family)